LEGGREVFFLRLFVGCCCCCFSLLFGVFSLLVEVLVTLGDPICVCHSKKEDKIHALKHNKEYFQKINK